MMTRTTKSSCRMSYLLVASMIAIILSVFPALGSTPALAGETTWVGTWSASPQPVWSGDFPLPTLLPFNLWNQTVRQKVRVSLGGEKFRLVLSNEYGKAPLAIASVHAAIAGGEGSEIDVKTDRRVTFSGAEQLTIPAGAPAMSDPVELAVPNRGDIVVSFYISAPAPIATFHWDGEQTGYIGAGNQVSRRSLEQAQKTTTRIFLSEVMVEAAAGARTVVVFGDSITDGAASGLNLNARWPDYLAAELAPYNVSVLNAGISGSRLLNSRMGENALARFTRDVLSQPHLATVVLLLGINDIAWPGHVFAPHDPALTPDQLIAGYRQLVALAHAHNVRIVVGTLTPFRDALKGTAFEGYYSEKGDRLRREVNEWLRTSGEFDAVVDFDRLVADPENPLKIAEDLQADHLHLSPRGNRMVAAALTPGVLFGER